MQPSKKFRTLLLAAALGAASLPALASTFTTTLPDAGPLDGGALNYTITSPGASLPGAATLTFDLVGYSSVDGLNCCTDTFKLTVNGNLLFSGGFDMGGGGTNFVTYSDPGVTIVSTASNGFFAGGLTKFSVAHTLLSGSNTYSFDYGVMQGLGDEAWGLHGATITASVTPTPEPETYAMMVAGLGLVGTMTRRRKAATAIAHA